VDLRDCRILLELYQHPFASYEAIGRAIDTSGTVVKARLERMQERGVVRGFYATPSARVFHRYWHVFAFQELEREPTPNDLLQVEDVASVWLGPPGTVVVNTFTRSTDSAPPPGLLDLVGRQPDQAGLQDPPEAIEDPGTVLSRLEWRVMDAVLERPRSPLADLSRSTGLTPRTVRKRRDALVAKGLLIVTPVIDTSREPGRVVYSGYVRMDRRADLKRVRVPGLLLTWTHHDPPAAVILGHAASYAEAREVERTLGAIPGVTHVDVTFSRGAAFATDRLRGWIREEIERWDSLRRASKPQPLRGKTHQGSGSTLIEGALGR